MTPLLVAVALTLFGTACRDGREDGTIHASGHIEATEVRLAAKVGGRLLELPFQEGAAVAAGDVVARFDTVDAAHELDRARAELDAADATLRLLLAGTRAEDVRQAEEELARAQTELDAAARDLARIEGLAERGTATVKARDDARTRRDAARRTVAGDASAARQADRRTARAGDRGGARPQGGDRGHAGRHRPAHRRHDRAGAARRRDHRAHRRARRGAAGRGAALGADRDRRAVADGLRRRAVAFPRPPRRHRGGGGRRPAAAIRGHGQLRLAESPSSRRRTSRPPRSAPSSFSR